MKKPCKTGRLKGSKLLCLKCLKYKPIDTYHYREDGFLNKNSQCRDCTNNYTRKWRKTHPSSAEALEKARDYRDSHKIQLRLYERKRLLASYGLTLKDYNKLLKKQKGACAICGKKKAHKKGKFLHVDHNHKTGKVRGLLCAVCNTALGRLNSVKILKKAIKYLRSSAK